MTYEQSTAYLLSLLGARGQRLGLERITRLVELLGRPDRAFRTIHVAGTNGKGSVCAMIDAGLRAAGKSAGFHSSPHLSDFTERFRVDGQPIEQQLFVDNILRVKQAAEQLAEEGQFATMFEVMTAAAFCVFEQTQVEWAVLETGLGGRLDATNVVQPELAVITPIDLDHQTSLGNTLAEIAGEKAGILKAGAKAVFSKQAPEAAAVLAERGAICEAVIWAHQDWRVRESAADHKGRYRLAVDGPAGKTVTALLGLPGEHQVDNAVTAIAALDAVGISTDAITNGLQSVNWPGRLEWIAGEPEVLLDAAHNPAGARSLANFIERFCQDRRITLIFGVSRDKAFDEMAALLYPLVDRVVMTQANVASRALTAPELAEATSRYAASFEIAADAAAAWRLASEDRSPEHLVVIAGSIFLIGELRQQLLGREIHHA